MVIHFKSCSNPRVMYSYPIDPKLVGFQFVCKCRRLTRSLHENVSSEILVLKISWRFSNLMWNYSSTVPNYRFFSQTL